MFLLCCLWRPMDTRYPAKTRRVWVRVEFFTREYGYEYEILPVIFVFVGGYLLYLIQT
jgi:hypothetical protein